MSFGLSYPDDFNMPYTDDTTFKTNEFSNTSFISHAEHEILFYARACMSVGDMKTRVKAMLEKNPLKERPMEYIKYKNLEEYFDVYLEHLLEKGYLEVY